jgi:cell division transport system permease protein
LNLGTVLLGFMFCSCVALVIHYVISLFMERYHKEILILYQLGASVEFITRPYLYQGVLLGLMGGVGALVILSVLFLLIQRRLKAFLDLYHIQLMLTSDDKMYIVGVIGCSVIFALLSAFFTTRKWLINFQRERIIC